MKNVLLLSVVAISFSLNAQMGFTPNKGQFADQNGHYADHVLFKACGTGPGIFVTDQGLTYVFTKKNETRQGDEPAVTSTEWSSIAMQLIGADIRRENVVTENELPGISNYYYAHCPQGI